METEKLEDIRKNEINYYENALERCRHFREKTEAFCKSLKTHIDPLNDLQFKIGALKVSKTTANLFNEVVKHLEKISELEFEFRSNVLENTYNFNMFSS